MSTIEILTIVALLSVIVFVAVLILKAFDWLTLGRRLSPEQERDWEANLNSRLLQPRFSELESYFDRPIPVELRRLYTENRIVLRRNLRLKKPNQEDTEHFIQHFLPAEKQSVEEVWGRRAMKFPFATDDFGNYFFVPMSVADVEKCPVFFCDCELRKDRQIANSLGEFLSWVSVISGKELQ